MSVFKRMRDMTKASMHELLDKVEDPVVMLNQYLRDMEEEIAKAEVTVAKQLANERRMLQRVEEMKRSAEARQKQAEAYLTEGNEDAAREALEEKLYYEEKHEEFNSMYESAREQAADLQSELHHMKDEFYKMRNKRNELAARAQMAKARKQMSEISSTNTIESGYASKEFHRMEERIIQMEIEADVSRRPHRSTGSGQRSQDPLTKAKVEEQLNALKEKANQTSQ